MCSQHSLHVIECRHYTHRRVPPQRLILSHNWWGTSTPHSTQQLLRVAHPKHSSPRRVWCCCYHSRQLQESHPDALTVAQPPPGHHTLHTVRKTTVARPWTVQYITVLSPRLELHRCALCGHRALFARGGKRNAGLYTVTSQLSSWNLYYTAALTSYCSNYALHTGTISCYRY